MNVEIVDLVTDLLRGLRLSGTVFLEAEFSAPWSIVAHVDAKDCKPYMAMPKHLIAYHYVVSGTLWVEADEFEPSLAEEGTLIVLPDNARHVLSSRPYLPPDDISSSIRPGDSGSHSLLKHGGNGESASVLCGFLGTDSTADPLLQRLPQVLFLNLDAKATGRWVEETIRHAIRRLAEGEDTVVNQLNRMAELLLSEAIIAFLETLPGEQAGWLRGLGDPVVRRALRVLHRDPSANISLDELVDRSSTSRSVLTERFRSIVGTSPIEYQRRLRLQLAAIDLERTQASVSSIGLSVGYGSEATFSRSFRQLYGMSPGVYRSAFRTSSEKSNDP